MLHDILASCIVACEITGMHHSCMINTDTLCVNLQVRRDVSCACVWIHAWLWRYSPKAGPLSILSTLKKVKNCCIESPSVGLTVCDSKISVSGPHKRLIIRIKGCENTTCHDHPTINLQSSRWHDRKHTIMDVQSSQIERSWIHKS